MDKITLQNFLETLNDPDILENHQKCSQFFQNPDYQPFFLLSYAEFLQIWGFEIHDDLNPERLNKWLIYTQTDWYNCIYNETWAYKWYPLMGKFLYNTVRGRPTSIIFSFVWIGTMDILFDRYMVFKNFHERKIKINRLFNHTLSKQQYIQKRQEYFEKYKELIKKAIENNTIVYKFRNIDNVVAGDRLNIYDPSFEWQKEQDKHKEELRKQFFIKNNQLALLLYRISNLTKHIQFLFDSYNRPQLREYTAQLFDEYVYSIPNRLRHELKLFSIYRANLDQIPFSQKFKFLLEYEKINKQKLFIKLDEAKLQISKIVNTYNYLVSGKISFERYEFKVFHRNLYEKKPELRIESYMYDFFTFAVFCLIPTTMMLGKKNYKQRFQKLKMEAKRQARTM